MNKNQVNQLRYVSNRIGNRQVPGNLFDVIPKLQSISRSLSRIAERYCNENMSEATQAKVEKREARLCERAKQLAAELGATFYYQSDPRGAAVYLVFPGDVPDGKEVDAYYSNGVAIY